MVSLYNKSLANEQVLKTLEKDPPSLTVHLYKDNWRFNQSGTCLYHTPIASLLDDIRAHRVPVDFLDIFKQTKVPFYNGCLIVELFDHRDNADPNEVVPPQHIVLWPTAEATWAELCSFNARDGGMWTDIDALNFEAKLLLQNAPDLCLDPDPLVSKVANAALLVSTPPLALPFKRKRSANDALRDEEAKAQRDRMMKLMNPRAERGFHASFRLLEGIQRHRARVASEVEAQRLQQPQQQEPQQQPQSQQHIAQGVQPQPQPQQWLQQQQQQHLQTQQRSPQNPHTQQHQQVQIGQHAAGVITPAEASGVRTRRQSNAAPPTARAPPVPQKKVSLQANATSPPSSAVESAQSSSTPHPQITTPVPQAPTPKPASGTMSALPAAAAASSVPPITRVQPTPVPTRLSPEATRSSTPASNSSPVRPDAPQGPQHPGIQPSGQFPQSPALRMPPNVLPQIQAATSNMQRPPSQQQIGRTMPQAAGAQHSIPSHPIPQQQPQQPQSQQSQPQSQGVHPQFIQQQQQPVQPRIAQMRQQQYPSQVNLAQGTHPNMSPAQMAQLHAQTPTPTPTQAQTQGQQQGRPTGVRTPIPPQASPPPQQQQPQQQTQQQQGQHQFHANSQRYPINGAIPVMGMMMGSQQPNGLPIQMGPFNPQMAVAAAAVMGNANLNRAVGSNPQNTAQIHPNANPNVGVQPQRPNSQTGASQRGPSTNIQHPQPQQQMHLGSAPPSAQQAGIQHPLQMLGLVHSGMNVAGNQAPNGVNFAALGQHNLSPVALQQFHQRRQALLANNARNQATGNAAQMQISSQLQGTSGAQFALAQMNPGQVPAWRMNGRAQAPLPPGNSQQNTPPPPAGRGGR